MNYAKPIWTAASVTILIAVGAISIVLTPINGGGRGMNEFFVGYLVGAIFGHTVAASAWLALGPGSFYLRAPLSILWCACLWLAIVFNVLITRTPSGAIIMILAFCIMGIWLAVQLPYWCLRGFGGIAICEQNQATLGGERPQYGIAQLLIFTTIVAVIFGMGRATYSLLPSVANPRASTDAWIFAYLAIAAVLMSLPLAPAIFLSRYPLSAICCILLLTGVATWLEMPIFNQVLGVAGGGPNYLHFIWINVATAGWILLLGMVVRWCGYRLAPRDRMAA